LAAKFNDAPLTDVLAWIWKRFGTRAQIGTSFQGAGLVMIDQALRAGFQFPVFTLDTNLLFPETYDLKARLEKHWGIEIEGLQPAEIVKRLLAKRIIASTSPYAVSYARLAPSLVNTPQEVELAAREVLALAR